MACLYLMSSSRFVQPQPDFLHQVQVSYGTWESSVYDRSEDKNHGIWENCRRRCNPWAFRDTSKVWSEKGEGHGDERRNHEPYHADG